MGLKIGYWFEFRGSKPELVGKIQELKARFQELPVTSVGDIVEIEHAHTTFDTNRGEKRPYLEALLGNSMALADFSTSMSKRAFTDRVERVNETGNGLALTVDVGEGCEYFQILLGRFGEGETWYGGCTTKTQYAEHFIPCHLTVIAMLDLCKETGILKKATDDGEYWETRDLNVLGKNMNISTDRIRAIVAALKNSKEGRVLHAPIEQSANYVRMEEDTGRRRDEV